MGRKDPRVRRPPADASQNAPPVKASDSTSPLGSNPHYCRCHLPPTLDLSWDQPRFQDLCSVLVKPDQSNLPRSCSESWEGQHRSAEHSKQELHSDSSAV